jgi:hypothetical protein
MRGLLVTVQDLPVSDELLHGFPVPACHITGAARIRQWTWRQGTCRCGWTPCRDLREGAAWGWGPSLGCMRWGGVRSWSRDQQRWWGFWIEGTGEMKWWLRVVDIWCYAGAKNGDGKWNYYQTKFRHYYNYILILQFQVELYIVNNWIIYLW